MCMGRSLLRVSHVQIVQSITSVATTPFAASNACPRLLSPLSSLMYVPAFPLLPWATKVLRAVEPLSALRLLRQCVELTSMARLLEEVRAHVSSLPSPISSLIVTRALLLMCARALLAHVCASPNCSCVREPFLVAHDTVHLACLIVACEPHSPTAPAHGPSSPHPHLQVQDDLERLKIKEIVQANEREARRDAWRVERQKLAVMREKFTAPGSLSALFSTSPFIVDTVGEGEGAGGVSGEWGGKGVGRHPGAIGAGDVPVLLAMEALRTRAFGPDHTTTSSSSTATAMGYGGGYHGGYGDSGVAPHPADTAVGNGGGARGPVVVTSLADWPAGLKGLEAMGLLPPPQAQAAAAAGTHAEGASQAAPLSTAFPTIARLIRRYSLFTSPSAGGPILLRAG